MLALGLAVASATLAIGWMAFHQLRSDLADSNARLPAKVGSVLSGGAPSTGSGTFLIAAPQGGIPGAVLMRVDPSTGVATTVELGSRSRVGANRVGDLTTRGDVTALVGALAQEGIPVNHVLLLAPGQIGNMIDALGGIAVSAPTGVTLLDTSGRSFGIRPGQIRLKGALADAYLFGQEQGDPNASPEQRQLDGLAAVGAAVLEPSSATLRTPNHLGGVIAKNTATDLTATTYLDELHAWGDVSRTVSCGTVDSSGGCDIDAALAARARPRPRRRPARRHPSGLPGGSGGWACWAATPPTCWCWWAGWRCWVPGSACSCSSFRVPASERCATVGGGREAEAGSSQTAAPPAVSVPSVAPPLAERRRLRLPHPLRRPGQPARWSHRRRFDPGRSRIGLPSWWTRRRTAAISGGFPIRVGPFRRHHHVVGGRGNLAGYAAVLAVAVGSGFVIAQLLTR